MDYLDADVAYLLGLVVARGTFQEREGVYQLVIDFPYSNLELAGIDTKYDQEKEIKVGLYDIQKRLYDLLATDIEIHSSSESVSLVARFFRRGIAWRNLMLILEQKQNYREFSVPSVFLQPSVDLLWKQQFLRGYGDVAGNIRKANRYLDGRHRVRLDVLNPNWSLPVQLCTLLQEHLGIPVQLINWGHPNLGRSFREHQINIFAHEYLRIGFTFRHKQFLLEELAAINQEKFANVRTGFCPGVRVLKRQKPISAKEQSEYLPPSLRGNHYDAYWQICRALGCTRYLVDTQEAQEEVFETGDEG